MLIFLLLSRSENYGIAVSEALSMSVPCIVAKTTPLREFLNEPGCFGKDYPPDPHAPAQSIPKVHSGNAKTGPLTDKIKTWDRIAQDYERTYNEVASTPRKIPYVRLANQAVITYITNALSEQLNQMSVHG
jgi:glycogen synthase